MKLTDSVVAALTLGDKQDSIFFDDLTGFGLRLRRGTGGKILRTWIAQYRRAGASRRYLIGSADVLNAEQARAKAKKVLAAVALGEDPQAEKTERRNKDQVTTKAVVDDYLADKRSDWRAHTERDNRRYLTGSYFAPLHGMAIDKVTRRDVASRIITIKREHGPIVAAAARAKLSAFFVWCLRQGMVELNPVLGTEQPKRASPRERVLSDDELAAIWNACGDDDYGRIVRLLILLGQRRQEVGGMAWSEFDLDAPQLTWTLPASRSQNGRQHVLPLMPMALDIIRAVPQMATREQLFGSRSGGGFSGWDKGKQALDKASGVGQWSPHDIRRTFSTRLHEELNVPPHVVEALLNHFSGHRSGSARPYNLAKYLPQMRQALATWERYIGLVTDRDLYAAHQAFLARGDEQVGEKASKAFHDAIAAGAGFWADYLRSIVEGERKVLNFTAAQTAS
jgi:integrase